MTQVPDAPMKQEFKRRKKLIQPKLQLHLAGSFAGICAVALLAQVVLLGAQLMRMAEELPTGGVHVADQVPGMLMRILLISFLVVLPALMLIGIRITFKVAGPFYRLQRHLESVASGEWDGEHCRLRESDAANMHEFCEALNRAIDASGRRNAASSERQTANADDSTDSAESADAGGLRVAG